MIGYPLRAPTPPDAPWDHVGDTTHVGRNELKEKDYGRTVQTHCIPVLIHFLLFSGIGYCWLFIICFMVEVVQLRTSILFCLLHLVKAINCSTFYTEPLVGLIRFRRQKIDEGFLP